MENGAGKYDTHITGSLFNKVLINIRAGMSKVYFSVFSIQVIVCEVKTIYTLSRKIQRGNFTLRSTVILTYDYCLGGIYS